MATAFLTQPADAQPASRAACTRLSALAGEKVDAGPVLQACIDITPAAGTIALKRGSYLIASPIRIHQALTLTTRGTRRTSPRCGAKADGCAVLHLSISQTNVGSATMPIDVDSDNVRIDRIVFEGSRVSDPYLSKKRCAAEAQRPMAGGLRVNGSAISITRSVFQNMACYTALEFGGGTGSVIGDNSFLGNGTHIVALGWADGLTIHGGHGLRVNRNHFTDNTDVQLIFGGCVRCEIRSNRFDHNGSAAGAAFAELMLHAWPGATTGDFSGTIVSENRIDCGSQHRCGFGIMLGAAPWYSAPTFGGTVRRNRVRGAMLALNVDRLSGPMKIADNDLLSTPGTYQTACGPRYVSASVNIERSSRNFFQGPIPSEATDLHYCILNFSAQPGLLLRPRKDE